MKRVVCAAIIASWLYWPAPWAWADEAAAPAIFSVAADQPARNSADAAAPSMILQVAAQTDIPQPKIFSVSNLGAENSPTPASSQNGGAGSACDACNSCDQQGCGQCNSSSCGQCGNSCNGGGCSDACGHGCCDACGDCFRPTWTFKAGALVMDRVSPSSTALVVETGTGRSLVNASGFSFNWTGGLDASLIRRIGDDNQLEARYFGLNNWTARQSFVTTTPAEIPIFPPIPIPPEVLPPSPAQAPSNVNTVFQANLYSAEVNWRHASNDTIGWLAGFRWLSTHEALSITVPDVTVRSITDNQLCGAQLGADLKVWDEDGPLHIDTVLKAGLYNNNASDLLETRNQLAFAGEIGVNIVYQCCEHVSVSAGYQLLWLTGVAVASDQIPHIDLTTLSGLDTGGNAFYHGAMFSVDVAW